MQLIPSFLKRKKQAIAEATPVVTQAATLIPGDKVYIEKINSGVNYDYEISERAPSIIDKLYDVLNGYYGKQNYIELFYCLPEVFAPIHEIASRVSDAHWQLCRESNDEVFFNDADFNRLFSQPNCLQSFTDFIYQSVVYEILTGGQFWFVNRPETLAAVEGQEYKNVIAWWNMAAQNVQADMKRIDPYTATELGDFINSWKEVISTTGTTREFNVESVIPILHLSFDKPYDLNCRKALILGADKPIRNLIPVYEARGTIYIKRGAMGFIVSEKSDESGSIALTPDEKKELNREHNKDYGLTGGRATLSVSAQPVRFERTAMSIEELQPFDETLSDAVAIYKVLRVPRHLVPSKDTSTFANADSDMKSFYEDVIIPWADKYAMAFSNYFKIPGKYVNADYSHIPILQANRKLDAEVAKVMGDVWSQRFLAGICTLNDWITDIEGTIGTDPIYTTKLPDMTPEQIDKVKGFLNMKAITQPNPNDPNKDAPKNN